jgi:hypothetical protein
MNWYSIFYWLTVADSVKVILWGFAIILTIFCAVCFFAFVFCRDSNDWTAKAGGTAERAKIWLWWCLPFTIVLWTLWAALPTKKDSLLIVAGGGAMQFLTTDSASKQIPHEVMNYVVAELKTMSKEAQVDLGIESQKDKILEAAKQMTASEILEKMKTDSTFAKIVLDK